MQWIFRDRKGLADTQEARGRIRKECYLVSVDTTNHIARAVFPTAQRCEQELVIVANLMTLRLSVFTHTGNHKRKKQRLNLIVKSQAGTAIS